MITTTKGGPGKPCSWKRIPGDQFVISFPNNDNRLNASLAPALSIAGRKQSGTASYLFVALDDSHQQSFVLSGSADERMVVDTVKAGYEWDRGNYRKATAHYRSAITQGSDPARLRLAWILATVREFQQPKSALRLLEPLEAGNKPGIAHTLAAAYAADQQYAKATSIAEAACNNSPKTRRKACLERLALYRNGQAYTTSVALVRQ
jgi:tetratricopeptide (TPR) repeat protein